MELIQGGIPVVDIHCKELAHSARVYRSPKGLYYNVMLNKANIQQNYNNFCLIQLLQSCVVGRFWVWCRWGRVGFKGQTFLSPMENNLDGALKMFQDKFYEMTENIFLRTRTKFEKVKGKYDQIQIDYTGKVVTSEKEKVQEKDKNGECSSGNGQLGSRIDERVKQLIQTICDEAEAQRLDYNLKKIPLGKITKEQINTGYEVLNCIEQFIRKKQFGKQFREAVNRYYTRIPHFFGMRTPPMISTIEMVKQEMDLLDSLTGIEVAKIAGDPFDAHYSRLNWDLVPLEQGDENFNLIKHYLLNTQTQMLQCPAHLRYRLELRSIFKLNHRDEKKPVKTKRFRGDLANRKWLWHGSCLDNWYGILAQGLQLPEAPVTGHTCGKGVYFSDCSTSAAYYSWNLKMGSRGFMLLCEVALGGILDLHNPDDQIHNNLTIDKNSVCYVGRFLPNPEETKKMNGIELPCGKLIQAPNNAPSESTNEFIVYNLNQIQESFLVEVQYEKNIVECPLKNNQNISDSAGCCNVV